MGHYLFACSGGAVRSPYAARWFESFSQKYGLDNHVSSASLYCSERDERWFNRVNISWMNWADRVIVMERKMQADILSWWPDVADKVVCIDVPDIFSEREEWAQVEFLDPVAPDAALRLYEVSGYKVHFGPRSFNKVLEANLERMLAMDT